MYSRTTKGKKNRNKGKQMIISRPRDGPSFPKQISVIPVLSRTLRYRSTGTVPLVQLYRRDFLNLIYGVSTLGLTTAFSVLGAIKIVSVRMWAFAASGDTSLNNVSADLTWFSANGPDSRLEDIGNSVRPAYISSRPPVRSLAAFWTNASSTLSENLITLNTTATSGTIVDVHFQYTLVDGPARTLTIVAVGSDNLLFNNLDNSTNSGAMYASSNLVPVGLTNKQAWG